MSHPPFNVFSMVRICSQRGRRYHPSSGHLRCPACRLKNSCTCGKTKQVKSATCGSCRTVAKSSNGNWKGGKTYHKRGYLMILAPEHPRGLRSPYVFEHILVVESMIGRYLIDGETVHHRNGVRDDNRPENLELWTRPQPPGIRIEGAVEWARTIIERYVKSGVVSPPTTFERNFEHPWRCGDSDPGPTAS